MADSWVVPDWQKAPGEICTRIETDADGSAVITSKHTVGDILRWAAERNILDVVVDEGQTMLEADPDGPKSVTSSTIARARQTIIEGEVVGVSLDLIRGDEQVEIRDDDHFMSVGLPYPAEALWVPFG